MILVVTIVVLAVAGAVVGYLGSRLLCRASSCPVVGNRGLMALFGAVLLGWAGYVIVTAGGARIAAASTTGHATAAPANITTQAQLSAALAAGQPVVVDFYADWCGPCKQLAPVVEGVAREYQGRVTFLRVNVDDASALADQFDVSSIPTLVFFRDGQMVHRTIGVAGKDRIRGILDELLRPAPAKPA